MSENSSFEAANEPLIVPPPFVNRYHEPHAPQEHHLATTRSTTSSNNPLKNAQESSDSTGTGSFLHALATLFLGFAVSFLLHFSFFWARIWLYGVHGSSARSYEYNDKDDILTWQHMPEMLASSVMLPLCLTFEVVYIYTLFFPAVVSIVNMVNTSPTTRYQLHRLLFARITTRTWHRLLLGGLVGACSAFVVTAWMLGETRLVPFGIVIMVTSVAMTNVMLFCCGDCSSRPLGCSRNKNNPTSISKITYHPRTSNNYYHDDHDIEDEKRGKRHRHSHFM
jgi:hypothetical protein